MERLGRSTGNVRPRDFQKTDLYEHERTKLIFAKKSKKFAPDFKHNNAIRLKVAIRSCFHKWALLGHMGNYMETRDHELFEDRTKIDIQLML